MLKNGKSKTIERAQYRSVDLKNFCISSPPEKGSDELNRVQRLA
ncbi:hypothetical protein VCRA2121O391_10349 [Vibrio crassostreae]|uniref:Uncharacterized protein n=1 Tax=Vibrio crassostreae TaxID=246167 RepID=A0ABP1WPJ8_9VIBR|nr:hypothetical protein VCRA2117O378_10349 [Vibrio crassostreae]CAK2314577.1 hypothetical protein VCRA2116O372_10287 [Vibrio crassostreae]CAK2652832.1 hypothetical protein VCRA2119O384_10287 [Vibrio crassostreae]CAK2723133.1 hypothetical protein VCRA2121O391_10349 [Vibrio crassostreae]CAK2786041.1 hypothetical protein VCRA2120O390_10349 [Vibrio crassostreae]